jgi:hypothetical protein
MHKAEILDKENILKTEGSEIVARIDEKNGLIVAGIDEKNCFIVDWVTVEGCV